MRSLVGWAQPRRSALCSNAGFWNRPGSGFAARPGWWAGQWSCHCACNFILFLIFFLPTLEETYLYLLRDGYCHFQTGFERVVFFQWMGWFRNYRFWDGLQYFLPFNSMFLNVEGQKLCELDQPQRWDLNEVRNLPYIEGTSLVAMKQVGLKSRERLGPPWNWKGKMVGPKCTKTNNQLIRWAP